MLGYCAEQAGDAQQAAEYYQLARQGGSTLDAGRYYNDQPADYLFWQGIALRKSGNPAQAEQHFRHFIDWAAQHRDDVPQVDFFAVSLPDLVVLDVSAQQRHQQHCLFIEALGHLGLGNVSACQQRMQQLLQINPAHDKAHLIRHALQSGIFPEPQWAGSARLNPTVPCVSPYRGIIMNNAQTTSQNGLRLDDLSGRRLRWFTVWL